jgi:hypothetical protein
MRWPNSYFSARWFTLSVWLGALESLKSPRRDVSDSAPGRPGRPHGQTGPAGPRAIGGVPRRRGLMLSWHKILTFRIGKQ